MASSAHFAITDFKTSSTYRNLHQLRVIEPEFYFGNSFVQIRTVSGSGIDTAKRRRAESKSRPDEDGIEKGTMLESGVELKLGPRACSESEKGTLPSAVHGCGGESAMVVCAEMREGTWGSAPHAGPGLYIEWVRPAPSSAPTEAPLPAPGDRVLEVNGVSLVSSRSMDELERALRLTPTPARLVLLRAMPRLRPRTPPMPPAITQTEVTSLRVELGSLRAAAEDAERTKASLKTDNTRLTHRISYLEEQVAELLARRAQSHFPDNYDSRYSPLTDCQKNVTNISIGAEPGSNVRSSAKSEVQVFQKGPDITAIVAKLPGLDSTENGLPVIGPRSSASSRTSPAPLPPAGPQRRSHSSHSLDHRTGRPRHSHPTHSSHMTSDYRADTDAALRIIERNRRHIERQRIESDRRGASGYDDLHHSCSEAEPDSAVELAERCRRDAADRIHETIKKTNWAERKTLSIIEQLKRSQRSRKTKNKNDSLEQLEEESERRYMNHRIDGKIIENAHKSSRRSSKMHSRSAKSSEFESECSDWPNGDERRRSRKPDYGSEPALVKLTRHDTFDERVSESEVKVRPTPPRKPVRLSLHKARSAHSLATGSETETANTPGSRVQVEDDSPRSTETGGKKPVKRSYGSGGDRWERFREGGRGTPRPVRRLDALSACDAPHADRLYPSEIHAPLAPRS
ncbi:hypothetical protein EVAR_41467_1 [Eumeta japonica]|uniref:PDZ domain-containing protein n=1 Tax=Eumeta variegata TaxID=151549 RepID=A0A4C1WZM4_EUMVA|nr:hypothetical protein EVAR_41467_1 [Eumeta japonica]